MFLVVIKGSNAGSTYALDKQGISIVGRGRGCDIRILDLMVSRKHCQLANKEDGYYIKDLNSTNKTIVNRQVVNGEQKLKIDDLIEVGNTVLFFTNQKKMGINNLQEYEKIIMKQTREINIPANEISPSDRIGSREQ